VSYVKNVDLLVELEEQSEDLANVLLIQRELAGIADQV
jgi:hypothetical protein